MTSGIVAIEKNHPEHWQIAAQLGFWDMTKNIKIGLGDVVYFWQSQKSLVSQTVVTSPAEPLTADDRLPWEDSGVRTYTHRFTFRVMSENARRQPTWSQLQSATGITFSAFRTQPGGVGHG